MVSRGQMLLNEAKLRFTERGFGSQHCSAELNAPTRLLQLLSEAPRNEYAQICPMTAGFAQKAKDVFSRHVVQTRSASKTKRVFCEANRVFTRLNVFRKTRRVPQD